MKTLITSLSLLLISLSSIHANADWSAIKASSVVVAQPPGNAITQTELQTLHKLETTRSDMDCQLGSSQALPSFDKFFVNKLHPILTAAEAAVLKDFVTKAMNLAGNVTSVYKNKYSRPRPLTEDSTLKPCAPTPSGNLSYPSAHSAMALAGACAIGKVLPDQADKVLQYANYIADLRAVVGVHHPSDVQAGKAVANQLCDDWTRDNSFAVEINQLRKSLKVQ